MKCGFCVYMAVFRFVPLYFAVALCETRKPPLAAIFAYQLLMSSSRMNYSHRRVRDRVFYDARTNSQRRKAAKSTKNEKILTKVTPEGTRMNEK